MRTGLLDLGRCSTPLNENRRFNIFTSPSSATHRDNLLFVGLSNDGLPGTAIVIFDDEDNLNLEIKHDVGNFNYCEESIKRIRIWYDRENPAIEFKYAESGNRLTMTTSIFYLNSPQGRR